LFCIPSTHIVEVYTLRQDVPVVVPRICISNLSQG